MTSEDVIHTFINNNGLALLSSKYSKKQFVPDKELEPLLKVLEIATSDWPTLEPSQKENLSYEVVVHIFALIL